MLTKFLFLTFVYCESYLTAYVKEDCPCWCGTGVTRVHRSCVWYELDSQGACVRHESASDSSPCGGYILSYNDSCYNGECLINLVSEKTSDDYEAGSNANFYYNAYTLGGQDCDIGKLDLPDYNDRKKGAIDTYYLDMPCNACMQSSNETFAHVTVTIGGNDGWKADWIMVEVNGNNATYCNPGWLDSKQTLTYDPSFCDSPTSK